jgi:Bacterial Ig domain
MRLGFMLAVGLLAILGCSISSTDNDGSPPQLAITHPASGDTVGGQVSIEAVATDDFGVDKVRFLIDGTLLSEQYTPPFRVSWNTSSLLDLSTHTIRVEASDVAKNTSFAQIVVIVRPGPH